MYTSVLLLTGMTLMQTGAPVAPPMSPMPMGVPMTSPMPMPMPMGTIRPNVPGPGALTAPSAPPAHTTLTPLPGTGAPTAALPSVPNGYNSQCPTGCGPSCGANGCGHAGCGAYCGGSYVNSHGGCGCGANYCSSPCYSSGCKKGGIFGDSCGGCCGGLLGACCGCCGGCCSHDCWWWLLGGHPEKGCCGMSGIFGVGPCASTCNMIYHLTYFPENHGYYYFRPYTWTHIAEHQALITSWGGDPRNPYSHELFDRMYASGGIAPPTVIDRENRLPSRRALPSLEQMIRRPENPITEPVGN